MFNKIDYINGSQIFTLHYLIFSAGLYYGNFAVICENSH